MITDICRCGNARGLHPEPAKGLKALAALVLADGVNVCIYGRFELDRKATYKAEQKERRAQFEGGGFHPSKTIMTAHVVNGCGECWRQDLPLRKRKDGAGYMPEVHACDGSKLKKAAKP